MAKQVETTTSPATKASNLYFVVETLDAEGKPIGSRIVDMYHFGTRDWLYDSHLWWAMHNPDKVDRVVVRNATPEEIGAYLDKAKLALAEKFNKIPAKAA